MQGKSTVFQPITTCPGSKEYINSDLGCHRVGCYPAYQFYSRKHNSCQPICNTSEVLRNYNCEPMQCVNGSQYINYLIGCCPRKWTVEQKDGSRICRGMFTSASFGNATYSISRGTQNASLGNTRYSISSDAPNPTYREYNIEYNTIILPGHLMVSLDTVFDYIEQICVHLRQLSKGIETFRCLVTLHAYTGSYFHVTLKMNLANTTDDQTIVTETLHYLRDFNWFNLTVDITVYKRSNLGAVQLTCPYIEMNDTQAVFNNHSVVYKGSELNNGAFQIKNGTINVCLSELKMHVDKIDTVNLYKANVDTDAVSTEDTILGVVTVICMSLSVLGLLIRIGAHFFVTEFHTFPMKLQFSFCCALLLADVLFLLLPLITVGGTLCMIYAAMMHYSFLCSFIWMSIVSYDMFRVFRSINNLDQFAIRPGWKMMVRYQLIGWLCPIVVIAITMLIEYAFPTPFNFKPRYGKDNCWLSNEGYGVLMYFGIPVFILIIFNCCIFIVTSRALRKAFRQSQAIRAQDKSNWKSYLKLFVVMGFSHVLVLFTPFVDHIALWIVIILLNASQGMLICIAFVCKQTILQECIKCTKSTRESEPQNKLGTGTQSTSL